MVASTLSRIESFATGQSFAPDCLLQYKNDEGEEVVFAVVMAAVILLLPLLMTVLLLAFLSHYLIARIESVVTGQAPTTLGWKEYLRK